VPLITVGHGPDDRVRLGARLTAAGVDSLVDVRRFPGSRNNPDVARAALADWLADLGIDYRPIMQDAVARARKTVNVEIIWASTREVFNVVEADDMGCHIITAPADVLKKLPALGTQTPTEISLAAVKAFRDDAVAAGLTLEIPGKVQAAE
jgi:transaldolase